MSKIYDWDKLKSEFILGKFNSLKEFAKVKKLNYDSGSFKKNTKGWTSEKAQYKQKIGKKIISKTIEKVSSKVSKRNARTLSEQDDEISKIIDLFIDELNIKHEELSMQEKASLMSRLFGERIKYKKYEIEQRKSDDDGDKIIIVKSMVPRPPLRDKEDNEVEENEQN